MNGKVLSLLSATDDESRLAGLTILAKLPNPPPPASVYSALPPSFVIRLANTSIKTANHSYFSLAVSVWSYLTSSPDCTPSTATSFLPLVEPLSKLYALLPAPADPPPSSELISTAEQSIKALTRQCTILKSTPPVMLTSLTALACRLEKQKPSSSSPPSSILTACNEFLKTCCLTHPNIKLVPDLLPFLEATSDLPLSLSTLHYHFLSSSALATPHLKTSSRMQTLVRRVVGASLNSENSPLRSSALLLFGCLLEKCGGKWALDASTDNKPLQAFVRISCGELRIHLSSTLEVSCSE